MTQHSWFLVSLVLFVVAGVLFLVIPETPRRVYAMVVLCAGFVALVAGFLVVN